MKVRRLGKSGLKVSELCLGAMLFSNFETEETDSDNLCFYKGKLLANKATSTQILDTFIAAGGNFIDTAINYNGGDSERFIGNYLASKSSDPNFRSSLIIATKVFAAFGNGPNDRGLSRHSILTAVESSLQRLQTTYIDVLQLDNYDRSVPLEETLSTLNDLVRQNKIHYIGVSNWTSSQLQRAIDISKSKNYSPIAVAQMQYNLVNREIEWEFTDVCTREGVGIICWSPLCGDLLSGRYSKPEDIQGADSRLGWGKKGVLSSLWIPNQELQWKVVSKIRELSEKYKTTSAVIAIRWILEKKNITGPIVGPRTLRHLEDNLEATKMKLSEEDVKILDEISAVAAPYPYSFQNMLGGVVDTALGMEKQS
eukprot:TRINITY_DN4274_c0_g1_i1.p1 TRINITY_DN4274_c0_g1~~TRINITY_DN4274_c0_g1_i1.p1  ORF type:complete len:368 (+),score=80.22 TRINITY_DN4274_c0_g1_i1:90-1193(+)